MLLLLNLLERIHYFHKKYQYENSEKQEKKREKIENGTMLCKNFKNCCRMPRLRINGIFKA